MREWHARWTPEANPRIWLDSLLSSRMVDELFTGNMTVVRQRANRPGCQIVHKKLTIRSERLIESDSYDIA
jgi:hypothetical protein